MAEAAILEPDVVWRTEQLLALGLTSAQALALSEQPDVAHQVAVLLAAGCSPRLAYRILR